MNRPSRPAASLICCLALIGVAWAALAFSSRRVVDEHSAPRSAPSANTIVLSPERVANSGIASVVANLRETRETHSVPARLDYAGLRRVDLKAPTESVVSEVFVRPGDRVEQGQRLALLHSPAIGLLRAELAKEQADARIAQEASSCAEEICDNLEKLIAALRAEPDPAAVSKQFEANALGQHRNDVLTAYTRQRVAQQLSTAAQSLPAGVINSVTVLERKANMLATREEFLGAIEQSRFNARQHRQKAVAASEYAARVAVITQQKLALLIGADAPSPDADALASPTSYFVVAPFAGSVEQREAVPMQRLEAGAPLFSVADTSNLWAIAEIRDRAWQALSLQAGDSVCIRVPALADKLVTGVVDHVGRQRSQTTEAVPLVIAVSNSDALLRPGMFAWAILPAAKETTAVVIPASGVLSADKERFVFVEEAPGRYRKQSIVVGRISGDLATVTSGLEPEQRVVSEGSFVLKSELALQRGGPTER